MKVIQINCMYKRGSTGKIVFDLHNELLSKGYSKKCLRRMDIRSKVHRMEHWH